MERFLGIPELLEVVLLQLDNRTLLTSANRVSRDWNELIQTSPQIQQKLFFRPAADAPTKDGADRPSILLNPLLHQHISKMLYEDTMGSPSAADDDMQARAVYRCANASWRKMLLASKGVKELGIWKVDMGSHLQLGFDNYAETKLCASEDGLWRMEDLLALVVQLSGPGRPGYQWTLLGREEGSEGQFEKEKNSLFVRKAGLMQQMELRRLWESSDVILKVTQWHEARLNLPG